MRRATPPLIAAVLALMAGCGSSDEETTGSAPAQGAGAITREVRVAWERDPACKRPQGASRWGCSVGSYRCQGVVTDRGWSISCSKPGRSVAFTIRR